MLPAIGPLDLPASLIRQAWEKMYIDVNASFGLAERALEAMASDPGHPCCGEAWFHISLARLRTGRLADGKFAIAQARGAFQGNRDERGTLLCDEIDATCLRLVGDAEGALAIQLRIGQRTDVQRQPIDHFLSHNWRAFSRKHLGQTDEMLLDFYQAKTAADDVDYPGPRLTALVNLGVTHKDLFNLVEAKDLLERGLDQAEAAQAWNAFAIASAHLIYTYEGLSLPQQCAALLDRLRRHEHEIPAAVLNQSGPSLAIGHLCTGDLTAARLWLRKGAVAAFGDGDGKTDFTRAAAHYFLERGLYARTRKLVDRRMAKIERDQLHDPPYARMRLLRVGATVCERMNDSQAALAYLHKAQDLFEALVAKNSHARFIALQASHQLMRANAERDGAKLAQEQAERHSNEVHELNCALQERIQESARLTQALNEKVAEAEALQRVLREQAFRDPLTGLFNRRFLSELGPGRIATARRGRIDMAMVLLDIDHFKRVNDSFGHAMGDSVLIRFARLLEERFRVSDTVSRFGGEEFLLLAEQCSEADLVIALNALQDKLRNERFGSGALSFGALTFSAGIAVVGIDGDSFDAMATVADKRMYMAKAAGRARIVGTEAQLSASAAGI